MILAVEAFSWPFHLSSIIQSCFILFSENISRPTLYFPCPCPRIGHLLRSLVFLLVENCIENHSLKIPAWRRVCIKPALTKKVFAVDHCRDRKKNQPVKLHWIYQPHSRADSVFKIVTNINQTMFFVCFFFFWVGVEQFCYLSF